MNFTRYSPDHLCCMCQKVGRLLRSMRGRWDLHKWERFARPVVEPCFTKYQMGFSRESPQLWQNRFWIFFGEGVKVHCFSWLWYLRCIGHGNLVILESMSKYSFRNVVYTTEIHLFVSRESPGQHCQWNKHIHELDNEVKEGMV